jgi:3-phytase
MKNRSLALSLCLALSPAGYAAEAPITARMQTEATRSAEANSAVLVLDAADAARSRIVATAALGGLEIYDLAGKRIGSAPSGEVASVDVAYDIAVTGRASTVLAAIDTTDNSLRFFALRDDALLEVGARSVPLGFAAEGVCLYRNRFDSALYAFVVGDGGEVDQHLVYANAEGKLDARQVRRIGVPSPLTQCVADSDGTIYAVEETVGVWRFSANPEADVSARLIDAPGLGRLDEEAKGVTLYDGGDGAQWLLVSDTSGGRINAYDRNKDDAYIGSFGVAAKGSDEAIEEPGPLFATSMALGAAFPQGLLLVADEDGGANYKAVAMEDVAAALSLAPGVARDPRRLAAPPVPVVHAIVESAPAGSYGDAADDPAIWAHPSDPAKSLVLATDKKAGLYVYDMQGKVLQFLPVGKMNNIDLRNDFPLDGKRVTLVTASDRTRKAIAIFRLDADARQLVDVADGVQPTGLQDPYGLCMYRSAKSGRTFVFINSGDGPKYQWELRDAGAGKVSTTLVRKLMFESQTEGCVADDASGTLFVGEEDTTLWRFDAEPRGSKTGVAVDTVAANPAIKDDIEGMGLYDLGNGRGYLVVSSQGNDTYAVYRREGKQEYLGSFAVVADAARGIDGISETDGLDISSANLGPGFEHGAMVAQDGRNVLPVENQNYKFVSWEAIAKALKLEVRSD